MKRHIRLICISIAFLLHLTGSCCLSLSGPESFLTSTGRSYSQLITQHTLDIRYRQTEAPLSICIRLTKMRYHEMLQRTGVVLRLRQFVLAGRRESWWLGQTNKTFTQEAAVCVTCATKSQHLVDIRSEDAKIKQL